MADTEENNYKLESTGDVVKVQGMPKQIKINK